MSWLPQDLVSDADLVAYEAAILDRFGQVDWQARRTKALEDWLFPILKGRGFDPHRLRTRYDCHGVQAYTGAAYSDLLGASQSATDDDINLATVLASGTDALYIGSEVQYFGVFVRMLESVSSAASEMTLAYWNGAWESLVIADGTIGIAGKTLSRGGSITWTLPSDWITRKVNTAGPYYWVKVTTSAVPTSAKASQIGTIRSSALRAPATYRTLQLIFQEAPTGADGPWRDKALFYKDEADSALQRALDQIGGEFDTDASDQVSEEESEQTAEESGGGPYTLERA